MVSLEYNVLTVLWFLFQLLFEINCQMIFKQRSFHTATLINNKLYILGGLPTTGKEFFYLDVSAPFNTQKLLEQNLSTINTVPSHFAATSVKGGVNNNTLFLYGGVSGDN